MHRFKCDSPALAFFLRVERAHIVKPIRKFYEDNTDVLCHSEEHLAEILHMLVLFILKRNADKLCKSVHKLGYAVAEELAYLIKVCFI